MFLQTMRAEGVACVKKTTLTSGTAKHAGTSKHSRTAKHSGTKKHGTRRPKKRKGGAR